MKLKLSLFSIALGVASANAAFAVGSEINVKVNGMVCGFCAQGITKKFSSEASVQSVDVKLSDKRVKLILKDDQNISDGRIKELLSDAGYNVEKIERN